MLLKMIFTLLLIAIISFIVLHYIRCIFVWRKSKMPTITFLPIIGHAWYLHGPPTRFFERIMKICSKIESGFAYFIGPIFVALFFDNEFITYMVENDSKLPLKPAIYDKFKVFGERMIFMTTGSDYKDSKKVMLEAVKHSNLKNYKDSFNQHALKLVDVLKSKDENQFDLEPELYYSVLSILLDTVIGLNPGIMSKDEIIQFSKEFGRVSRVSTHRMSQLWIYPDCIYELTDLHRITKKRVDFIRSIIENIVIARRERFLNGEVESNSVFIDKYFITKKDNGEEYPMDHIVDDVTAIIGAGFETTVISIGFCTMLMAIHQDVQNRVYQEILDNIHESENHQLTFESLGKLRYLEQVVKETWRLYPPVTFYGRQNTEEFKLPNGGRLVPGTILGVNTFMLHRDPKVFPNPEVFNPDNFTPEKEEARSVASFLPFGFGSRKCFGNVYAKLVIKCILCHMLRNFSFHTTVKVEDFILSNDITLTNQFGFPVSMKPRS